MTHIYTKVGDDGETRDVYLGDDLIGWCEPGRQLTDLKSSWTEWRFVPAAGPDGPVRRSLLAAREDAQAHADQLIAARG